MKNIYRILLIILGIIIIGFIGWLIGRNSIDTKTVTKIEYIEGETIVDSVDRPVPVYIVPPIDTCNILQECIRKGLYSELFPERIIYKDSLIYVPESDTTAIVIDWATERYYEETLFDNDTSGTCIVKFKLQYNRLMNYKYSFTPVNKVIDNTTVINRKYEPFIGAGISTLPTVTGQAGLFIDHLGFSYQYQYDWKLKNHIHGINVLYKF